MHVPGVRCAHPGLYAAVRSRGLGELLAYVSRGSLRSPRALYRRPLRGLGELLAYVPGVHYAHPGIYAAVRCADSVNYWLMYPGFAALTPGFMPPSAPADSVPGSA